MKNYQTLITDAKKGNAAAVLELRKEIEKAICTNHDGKMKGINSLSTACTINPQCAKNAAVKGSICSKCFAMKYAGMRKALKEKLERNVKLLTAAVLPSESLPLVNSLYFRFEAFGDLMSAAQAVNYFNIAKKNKSTRFALWTKNPHFIDKAIKEYGIKKPANLNIIFSSLFINAAVDPETIRNKYPFIDKVFTVYDAAAIEERKININCGARSCANCLKCYKKNNIVIISEKLK